MLSSGVLGVSPFPGGRSSATLYDQLLVAQGGGLEVGAILFLFGGVATVVVVTILGLTRGERPSLGACLVGAVTAWSLTWIGPLLQTVTLRENVVTGRLSLEVGFWLQAVSIGVGALGTTLVWFGKRSEVKDSHDRYADS